MVQMAAPAAVPGQLFPPFMRMLRSRLVRSVINIMPRPFEGDPVLGMRPKRLCSGGRVHPTTRERFDLGHFQPAFGVDIAGETLRVKAPVAAPVACSPGFGAVDVLDGSDFVTLLVARVWHKTHENVGRMEEVT